MHAPIWAQTFNQMMGKGVGRFFVCNVPSRKLMWSVPNIELVALSALTEARAAGWESVNEPLDSQIPP